MSLSTVDILLVDDRQDGLTAMEAVLKDKRFNLVTARSGREALDLLSNYEFAVILLDVQMPGLDGFETANLIKQREGCRYTPIIFVTAIDSEDSNYIYKGYEYGGAVDYVFKPFDGRILYSKVSVFGDLYLKSKKLEEQTQIIRDSSRQEKLFRLAQLEVESLKRYQNLADSIPHIVWRAKPNGTMDYFNRVWTDYTGFSDQQSSGIGWQTAFHHEDLRQFLKVWMQAMEKGEDFQVECRIISMSGNARWHWVRGVAERGLNGEVIAWLGTSTDINQRKEAEEKLIEKSNEATAASLAKTHFLANMSHEIRTPLNSIIGFTDLLMYPTFSQEDQAGNLAIIKRSGQQLLKIIDEVLDISKVETGRLEVMIVDADLRTLLTDLQVLLQIQAREKNIALKFKCLSPIPRRIFTDSTRYRQILTNIIGNAIKFTTEGSVTVEFSWIADAENESSGKLRCLITDTGLGIKESHVDRLFQPFMQVDSSMTRKFGGAGLGLALSRRLAKALGGDVYLKSTEPDKGTTFAVDIQAVVLEGSTLIKDLRIQNYDLKYGRHEIDAEALADTAILVVDDANDNRILISRFLNAAGAKIEVAKDGREAIDMALAYDYQLVLMDIQMPVLDGYSATIALREKGYQKPIIALTAHALKEDRERSLQAGCTDHLTKPIDRASLLNMVGKYIKKPDSFGLH